MGQHGGCARYEADGFCPNLNGDQRHFDGGWDRAMLKWPEAAPALARSAKHPGCPPFSQPIGWGKLPRVDKGEAMLVPYETSYPQLADSERRRLHEEEARRKREGLLSELRLLTGLPDVIRACKQDVLYKLVVPEGEVLQQIPGTDKFRGVFYGENGRVKKHAQFTKVGPSVITAAKAVGAQVLLVSIAMQLNEIQRQVEQLSLEMHRDRIAEIQAGESQLRSALMCVDEANRKPLVHNAIQSLHVGLKKTTAELRARIIEAPKPESGFLEHLSFQSKLGKAERIMALATESFFATMRGLGALSECYAVLGEPMAAQGAVCQFLDDIEACDIEQAARKARLLEPKGPILPQVPWRRFLETAPVVRGKMAELASSDTFEIEFRSHELLGAAL